MRSFAPLSFLAERRDVEITERRDVTASADLPEKRHTTMMKEDGKNGENLDVSSAERKEEKGKDFKLSITGLKKIANLNPFLQAFNSNSLSLSRNHEEHVSPDTQRNREPVAMGNREQVAMGSHEEGKQQQQRRANTPWRFRRRSETEGETDEEEKNGERGNSQEEQKKENVK